MFTYIDPAVRQHLSEQGTLFQIDRNGARVDEKHPASGSTISILGPIPLPLKRCGAEVAVQWKNPLVRVHSSCLTGDVFGSERCECGPQLQTALERIQADEEGGLVIYMSGHEGRGIGLWAKAATYLLQDAGEDTYEANRSLGLPDDSRDFSDAAALLKYFLSASPFRLLTNNPKKVEDLTRFGLRDIERVKHVSGVGDNNRRYLNAKLGWGHKLSAEDLKSD